MLDIKTIENSIRKIENTVIIFSSSIWDESRKCWKFPTREMAMITASMKKQNNAPRAEKFAMNDVSEFICRKRIMIMRLCLLFCAAVFVFFLSVILYCSQV